MAVCKAKPEFEEEDVDRETDPERNSEKLAEGEMREGRHCEEDAHDGSGGCDAEENGDGAEFPAMG